MGMSFSKKPEVKSEPKLEPKPESRPELFSTVITQSVGLKFSTGYEFQISVESGKMTIRAVMQGQEAFFLDEIPPEFVAGLKRILA